MQKESVMRFAAGRLVYVSFIIAAGVFAGVVEYFSLAPSMQGKLKPVLNEAGLEALKNILMLLAFVILLFAFRLKRAISAMEPGVFLKIAKAITRNANRMQGSAFGMIMTIGASCEAVGIFGLLMFFLSGGDRVSAYIFIIPAILLLLLLFPRMQDAENLEKIESDSRGQAGAQG